MARKEFLFNRNNVAYCTSISKKFEPNKSGVIKESTNMNTFCFEVATNNLKPEYPMTRVVKAVPNKKLKEKWIEKTFYVTVPVKAQKEDLDDFLQRVGDFQVDFKEAVGYSVKGIAKMKKGGSIRFKGKEGAFALEFGDKVNGEFEFVKDGPKGMIEKVLLKSRLKVLKKTREGKKNIKRDSQGRPFDFYESPFEDIELVMDEMIRSEVNTICRSDRFKIVIDKIQPGSLREINKENGEYTATIIAKMLTL